MKKQPSQPSAGPKSRSARNEQPASVHNDAPGYGNKKLEGPNRPST